MHACRLLSALIACLTLATPSAALAQEEPTNFTNWLRREITLAAAPAEPRIAANGNGVSNQRESPSTDTAATSLVDTSSASDFVSLALNVTGLRPPREGEDDTNQASGSVTASRTINGSYDYSDRKELDDRRSGRFATEFQAKLGNPQDRVWSARPVMLSGSGEVRKASGSDALIRLQAKLGVPITAGVDVPIAYYANRDDEGIVAGSNLKFSLAIDPVRFRERFR